jgi:hypothetical protein
LLPPEEAVYVVGAEPSDEVREVITEPDLFIHEPEDESTMRSPLSLEEEVPMAAWMSVNSAASSR